MVGNPGRPDVGQAPTHHTILGPPRDYSRIVRTNQPGTQESYETSPKATLTAHINGYLNDH